MHIEVKNNDVTRAMKRLTKKMQRDGVFTELRRHEYYTKPSEDRRAKQKAAIRRRLKADRKKAQLDARGR